MELHPRREGDALLVRYELTNDFGEDLFLCNLIPDDFGLDPSTPRRRRGRPPITSALAYACHRPPDEVVFFQGRVLEPRDFDGTAPVVPFFTRVAPGATFAATFRAGIPLREWHPYARPGAGEARPALVERLTFRLGYVLRSRSTYLREPPEHPGAFIVREYPMPVLERSLPLDAPVPMEVRTSGFTRFA
jgi:hypothetical protein